MKTTRKTARKNVTKDAKVESRRAMEQVVLAFALMDDEDRQAFADETYNSGNILLDLAWNAAKDFALAKLGEGEAIQVGPFPPLFRS